MSPGVYCDINDSECLSLRDDLKRFRNEYSKPVQFRCVVDYCEQGRNHKFILGLFSTISSSLSFFSFSYPFLPFLICFPFREVALQIQLKDFGEYY